MVAEESVEQKGELLVLLSQGGSQEEMELLCRGVLSMGCVT